MSKPMQKKLTALSPYLREAGPQHGDSWKNRPRRIYDHQFIFGVRGQSYITIDQNQHHITPGVLVLIPPNTHHSFWVENGDQEENETFYVHLDFFYGEDQEKISDIYHDPQEYIRLFGNIPLQADLVRPQPVFDHGYVFPECIKVADRHKAEQLFRQLAAVYAQKATGWHLTGKKMLTALLELIYLQTNVKEKYTSVIHREIVEEMKQFIRGNYFRKINAAEVAQTTGLSSDHASRVFKKLTGMRLVEYIARYRIDKARELMLERDLSLEEIALMVGFDSQVYFSQTVKKYEGVPPFALRSSLVRELKIT